MLRTKMFTLCSLVIAAALALAACSPAAPATVEVTRVVAGTPETMVVTATPLPLLAGDIAVDGSSTVYPITEAVAEDFGDRQPDVHVTVGISGTGGGFKKFCNNETDISNASRAIKDSEKEACKAAGVEYEEFLVGLDGLTVVVNPQNTWAACLTTAQLKAIWDAGSTIANWNDVDPAFPDQPLALYGPGTDSGTFDFFTEVINGKAKQSRADYTASEDDNVLVQGVEGDANALGYFGLAYYIENEGKLKAVQIDGGQGCVAPSFDTVASGDYAPLSRPLFIYVKKASLARPEVFEFVKFFLSNANEYVPGVGYVEVEQAKYDEGLARLATYGK